MDLKFFAHWRGAGALALGAILGLSGCGDSASSGPSDISYTGSTAPVTITQQNAESVGTDAYLHGSGADGLGSFSSKPTVLAARPKGLAVARVAAKVPRARAPRPEGRAGTARTRS